MKILLISVLALLLVSMALQSCCLGNHKCKFDETTGRLAIRNSSNQNLVFGPNKIYDKNYIRLYSLNGTDTVFHRITPGPSAIPSADSLLYVDFDYRKFQIIYVRLTSTDLDTLKLVYATVDASPCCPDYQTTDSYSFNNQKLHDLSTGIISLQK